MHRGLAVVFEDFDDDKGRINDDDLDKSCVMVLENFCPKRDPGMAEVGSMGLPLDITVAGLEARLKGWIPSVKPPSGGYEYLFHTHVQRADTGADFDFLVSCRGAAVGRDSH